MDRGCIYLLVGGEGARLLKILENSLHHKTVIAWSSYASLLNSKNG
jgi:hypothetical protein